MDRTHDVTEKITTPPPTRTAQKKPPVAERSPADPAPPERSAQEPRPHPLRGSVVNKTV